jgi:hypothetical protein
VNTWQTVISTVIPAVLALLGVYRGAISSTSRLIRAIRVNVELLDKLSADDPTRAKLEARNGKLVDVLMWRQHRQFTPLVSRWSLPFAVPFTVAALLWGVLIVGALTGTYRPESPAPEALWLLVAVYAALLVAMVILIRSTDKLAREQRRLLQQVDGAR